MRRLYNLLATILVCVVGASASAQIVVTFTGRDSTNQYHIPLHHVDVFNLDQLWEEVLYYPDTTLILGTVGVDDYELLTGFELKQNVPNPFDGTTEFALVLPEGRDVLLEIYDITGKLAVGKHFSALPSGTHLFQATLTSPQTYLLSAKLDNGQMTIKMVNEGHGAGNSIRYLGMTDANGDYTLYLKDDKTASGYPFSLGDEMKYIGYAEIDDVMRKSNTILRNQNANEIIPLRFEVSAPSVNTKVPYSITATTAASGVQVVSNGGAAIKAWGICWSTSSNPTIDDDTISGFTGVISGLSPNTTYHVRAFATNSVGTAYGADESFTTLCDEVNVSITGTTTINYGQFATLFASGANSYQWSTGNAEASITVNPTSTTTYTVTGTNSYGCTDTASVTVVVNFLPPTVITGTVDNITATTAICGGNVVSTGGAAVTERGVCWSTSPNPMASGNHLLIGNGMGSFDDIVTGLTPNTTYHVRAYAINSVGTSYGADSTFTTICDEVNINVSGNTTINYGESANLHASGANTYHWSNSANTQNITVTPTTTTTYTVTGTNIYGCSSTASVTVTVNPIAPVVATNGISSITSTSAKCGGNVMDNGGAPVIERGICWSTSPNPTVSGSHLPVGNGTGSFTSIITGLTPNTTYHVRAYATNSVNTSYGGDSTFTTLCDTVNISITGNTTINYGQSAILIASGANSYSWNNGSSTAAITISPTVTTSYTVTGMNIHGCTATASVTVTVNPIAPTVITNGITNITSTTASCGGTVTDNGGTTVFVRGICWSTSPNPTVSDNSSNNNDGGMGHFSRNISGLNPNTTYHVRAYAINSVDTAYGADSVFTTLCNAVNISIAGNTSIDYGQSTTLTASGTNSYQWSTGANTGSITVSPTAITTYTVTGTNSYGCTATVSVTVTVNYLEPTVTTQAVSNITATSANCGGTVTFDGGKTVTSRGVCWGLNPNPSLSGSHLPIGNGVGGFSDIVSNLTPNTTYYVRAYAINIVDTAYGSDVTFKTLCNTVNLDIAGNTIVSYGESTTLTASGANSYHWSTNANNESILVSPITTTTYTVTGTNLYGCTATASVTVTVNFLAPVVVTNNDVNSITSTSAICGGTVTSDGGASVTARGVCWSTSPNPTVSACCTTNDGGGMGSFTSYITGLTPGTTYYVRAYATNSEGTSYGEPRTFTTHTTPTVTTATVTDVTGYTAICGGTVTGDGGTSVTVRGVCWSISENPTINDSHTNDGNGVGSFTSNITGLSEGITYHVRAYATNNVGTSYGADITFTTPLLPTVITDSISNITDSTAICGGVVVSDGGATVTARGVCWSSIPNPTVNDFHTIDGSGTGNFNSSLQGLIAGTMYYVRAYATSVAGTAYGQQVVFATTTPDGTPCVGTPTVTDIDGNIYNTVQIGGQCWMKENLKTTRYANGTNVSMGNSYNYSSSIAYRFNPNYDAYNVPYYGYLYNWTAVMHGTASSDSNPSGVQGICPNGWHVPSVAEWVQLTDYVSSHNIYRCNGIVEDIAKAMSSTTGWVSSSTVCEVGNDQSSNNATGFSIVPAGCFRIGYQSRLGEAAYLWSATEYDAIEAYGGYVDNNSTSMPMATNLFKDAALTVRCVLDSVSSEYSPPPSTFCKTVKIIPVVYNDATEPFCPTYGLLTLTVVDSVTGNPIPNLTYTWSGESVNEASTDSTSYVAIIPEWCDTVYTAFVTVNDGQGCVKTVSRTIDVASSGPIFIGTLADTTVPRQSGCKCFIPDFRDLITNSILTDDCFTLSNIKSTSFWYAQSPQAGTELTGESQVVTITITNPCGKSNTITVNVHKSADIPVMVLTSTPNHFCAQTFEKAGDGTITVIAPTSGSGHAYTYKIFDANDNELSIPNFPITLTQYWLSHQTYRVQAYESTTGCSVSDTITVSHNPYSVDFSFMITPNTACSSVTGNGSITVTNPTSTNPNPDFTYSIDNVHYSTNPVFTDLADGTYSVYVKDATSECIAEKSVSVTDSCVPVIPAGDAQPCPGMPTVSDVDGNVYNTVKIGGQCWMKENLRTTKYADGTAIPAGGDYSSSYNSYYYDYSSSSIALVNRGYLYNWPAVMHGASSSSSNPSGVQGICPTGWHVPSEAEWTELEDYVGSQSQFLCGSNNVAIAKALASTSGWDYTSGACVVGNNQSINNSTGFSVFPAGTYWCNFSFHYSNSGFNTCLWSSTGNSNYEARGYFLSRDGSVMSHSSVETCRGYSVRCLWDSVVETQISLPTVITDSVTAVSSFYATTGGNVISSGGGIVSARGVCWGTEQNPTIDDNYSSGGQGAGTFTIIITGLSPATTYYVRAYATNSVGTVYGEEWSFTTTVPEDTVCPQSVTDIDGNTYSTVRIGGQCWMRENLRTTKYADGSSVIYGNDYYSNSMGCWYYPNNDSTNKQAYGLLYNWPAVMHGMTSSDATPSGVQGICPEGWHVPSEAEWRQLTDYVSSQSEYWCDGDSTNISKALASPIGWGFCNSTCSVCNQSPNNATGFCAMPAGYGYWGFGDGTSFWSATSVSSSKAKTLWIGKSYSWVEYSVPSYIRSYSVRCLYDEEQSQYFPTVSTDPVTNISSTSAVCGGNITSSNGSAVIARGVCWSIFHNPTVSDAHSTDGAGEGSFTSAVINLSPNNTYYVRAYASTAYGTVYGNEVSITIPVNLSGDEYSCPNTPILYDADGNAYNTVQLGGQCWMRENLRTTKYADGSAIAFGNNNYSSNTGHWYYPDDDTTFKSNYGLLYNWPAVMRGSPSSETNPSGVQGICPTGWHVPSVAEWKQMTDYVSSQSQYWCEGDSTQIAKSLASTSGWLNSISSSCSVGYMSGNNNSTFFGALPAGAFYGDEYSEYEYLAEEAHYWTTVQYDNDYVYYWEIYNGQSSFHSSMNSYCPRWYIGHGYSVRCLRDETGVVIDEKSCPNTPTVTDHEGNVYATVQIGDQCWMRDNLRTITSPSTGTYLIPSASTAPTYTGKQARWYNNDSATYAPLNYGLLYNWNAAVDTFNTAYGETSVNISSSSAVSVSFTGYRRGICPIGWHIPSDAEWTRLTSYVRSQSEYVCGGNTSYIGKALADSVGWCSYSGTCYVGDNQSTNDATGFSAVPAGYCYGSSFGNVGTNAGFWSSSYSSSYPYNAYTRYLGYNKVGVNTENSNKDGGRSVRCLRDETSTAVLPTVTTGSATAITSTSAICGGNVSSNGGANVTARGVCWSTSHNPTIEDAHTTDGVGTGDFSSNLTGLTPNTTYYMRAYATNSVGTAYGEEVSFTTTNNPAGDGHPCPDTPTLTDVDGNIYNTVMIGDQCWMRENLRTTKYSDGINILQGNDTSTAIGYWYYPNNIFYNKSTFGLLYNWKAVMRNSYSSNAIPSGIQGICPDGWHVPSDAEWTQLTDYVSAHNQYVCGDDNSYIAKALASTTFWYSSTNTCAVGNNSSANNTTGFDAMPAGYYYTGGYANLSEFAYFWSTSVYSNSVWNRFLGCYGDDVSRGTWSKSCGFSVRCLRDEIPHEAPTVSSLPYSTNFYDDTTWTLNNGACGNYWETNSTYGLFVTNDGTTPGYIETQASTVMAEKLLLMPSSDSIHIEFDVRVGGESSYDYLKVFLSPSSTTYTAGTSHNTQSDKSYSTYAVNFSSFIFQTGNSSNPYTFNLTNGTTVHISVNMVNPNPNDTAKLVFLWRDDTSVSTQPGAVVSQLSVSEVTTAVIDEKSCPTTPTVTDHEGNVYATVQIGDQCWMRDNLRTTTSPCTGTYLIPSPSTGYTYTGKQARWYNNDSATYAPMNYGLLYNWNAAVDTFNTAYGETSVNISSSNAVSVSFTGHRRGICPVGWHLPSNAEWTQLTNYVKSQNEYVCGTNSNSIAKALADSVGWNSYIGTCCVGNNQSTNNATGFSAVPAGYHYGSSFYNSGSYAYFWSSTEYSSSNAYGRGLDYNNAGVGSYGSSKSDGYSVRCLRD